MSTRHQLVLATLAFTICFYGWSLLGPLGPDLQEDLELSDVADLGDGRRPGAARLADADPARLARRPLRRPARVHGADGVHAAAADRARALSTSALAPIIAFGFLLGFAGASFAVGVPFVNGWYTPERQGFALGLYGMGMGGTVIAGLTAPKIADEWGLAAPFWFAAALVAVMAAVWAVLARDAERAGPAGPRRGCSPRCPCSARAGARGR